jgi:predicted RNA-binding protein associated with RNAse of E/G family
MSRWSPGDHIVLREVWQRRVWTTRPAIVVEDTNTVIALFLANGSNWKRPFDARGRRKRIPGGHWTLGDDTWNNDVVRVSVPGERFSVLPISDSEGHLRFWYINVETPLRRSPLGFDYMDQTLDITVDADMRAWRWKDEEELAEAVTAGIYTANEASDIRAAGEAALEHFLDRKPPLDREWDRWRPAPQWGVPELCGDWGIVSER